MGIKVEISVSDFIDRYTILLLKEEHGLDVADEIEQYKDKVNQFNKHFVSVLYSINKQLWAIENYNRQNTITSDMTIVFNDTRSAFKKQIDQYYSSNIQEQKNYENTNNG